MSVATDLNADQSQQLIFTTLTTSTGFPVLFAQLVTAQSGHETDGWTSNVYLTDNNAFGYGFNGVSYTAYASVEDSVQDMIDYINRRVADGSFPSLDQITTPDQYATLLKNAKSGAYFGDTVENYENGITNWLDTNLTATQVAVGGGAIIAIFVIAFILLSSKST
jgi:mannosyl-glycoprotein endo-beta-N-acetylglucosaminidase